MGNVKSSPEEQNVAASSDVRDHGVQPVSRGREWGLSKYSGIYLTVLLVVFFSAVEPSTFFTLSNLRVVLQDQAITGILTLGLIISLIAGVFDLSVAANMSLAIMLVGWLQSSMHVNWALAVAATLAAGVVIGIVNALVITKLKVDSVIATLGMSSVLAALTYVLTDGVSIVSGINPTFSEYLGAGQIFTIPLPTFYLVGVALVLWYVLDHTPLGRYLHATGANIGAARLSGLNVVRIQWAGLMISGVVASAAGIVFTAQLQNASYDAGTPYLLPAFTAAFLGFTQIKPGRFNVWGTVVALYLVQVGITGLELLWPGAPWVSDLFEGIVLIVAVALAVRSRGRRSRALSQ